MSLGFFIKFCQNAKNTYVKIFFFFFFHKKKSLNLYSFFLLVIIIKNGHFENFDKI
jgi:hypothetical protein